MIGELSKSPSLRTGAGGLVHVDVGGPLSMSRDSWSCARVALHRVGLVSLPTLPSPPWAVSAFSSSQPSPDPPLPSGQASPLVGTSPGWGDGRCLGFQGSPIGVGVSWPGVQQPVIVPSGGAGGGQTGL